MGHQPLCSPASRSLWLFFFAATVHELFLMILTSVLHSLLPPCFTSWVPSSTERLMSGRRTLDSHSIGSTLYTFYFQVHASNWSLKGRDRSLNGRKRSLKRVHGAPIISVAKLSRSVAKWSKSVAKHSKSVAKHSRSVAKKVICMQVHPSYRSLSCRDRSLNGRNRSLSTQDRSLKRVQWSGCIHHIGR